MESVPQGEQMAGKKAKAKREPVQKKPAPKEKVSKLGEVLGEYHGTTVYSAQVDTILRAFAGKEVKLTEVSRAKWTKDSGLSNEGGCANVVRWMAANNKMAEVQHRKKSSITGLKFR